MSAVSKRFFDSKLVAYLRFYHVLFNIVLLPTSYFFMLFHVCYAPFYVQCILKIME